MRYASRDAVRWLQKVADIEKKTEAGPHDTDIYGTSYGGVGRARGGGIGRNWCDDC